LNECIENPKRQTVEIREILHEFRFYLKDGTGIHSLLRRTVDREINDII